MQHVSKITDKRINLGAGIDQYEEEGEFLSKML